MDEFDYEFQISALENEVEELHQKIGELREELKQIRKQAMAVIEKINAGGIQPADADLDLLLSMAIEFYQNKQH